MLIGLTGKHDNEIFVTEDVETVINFVYIVLDLIEFFIYISWFKKNYNCIILKIS